MPVIHQDPFNISRWVIFNPERAIRPTDQAGQKSAPVCPLCEGNEKLTPPEVLAYRPSELPVDGPGWSLRVVPNKFPALRPDEREEKFNQGPLQWLNGVGVHEVIIENPDHQLPLSDLPSANIRNLIVACQERYHSLSKDRRLKYIQIFKNFGDAAGASLSHGHCQLIATPLLPPVVEEGLKQAQRFFSRHGHCLYCSMIDQESKAGTRIIAEDEHYLALSPFAARFPYEIQIIPKRHMTNFTETTADEITALAELLKDLLTRLRVALNDPAYNLVLRTAPCRSTGRIRDYFHWHLEIIPRMTKMAGFELGSGIFINPVIPEQAATMLRFNPAQSRDPNGRVE